MRPPSIHQALNHYRENPKCEHIGKTSNRIHTYIRTYVHTYIHTYLRTYMHACIHYITLRYVTLHYITLHFTLHFTLHSITLHYVTLIHIYISTTLYVYIYILNIYIIYVILKKKTCFRTWAQPALNIGPDCFHTSKHCALCLPQFNIALPGCSRRISAQSSHTVRQKSLFGRRPAVRRKPLNLSSAVAVAFVVV